MAIRDEAYEQSKALLHELTTPSGSLAAKQDVENYERVWARDGVIAGIASLLTSDAALADTFKNTLETLHANQDDTGRIPSNVTPGTDHVSYGSTVGRVDATLWYVIGIIAVAKLTDDVRFFEQRKASVDKALFYLRCLELNGKGLLYIPQGGDWADEYINHGYVLFDEMLYYIAQSAYASLTGDATVREASKRLGNLIRINYFPAADNSESPFVYHKALFDYAVKEYMPPLPAAYFTNHSIRFHMDTFAIALLLMSDLVDDKQHELIRTYVRATSMHDSFPILPAFHPVITDKDYAWQHLKLNFLYEFRNKPNEYHNGGLWPLVHGFFLASFPQEEGLVQLDAFAHVLARDEYVFPEYYHGLTFEAEGTKKLGFSASAYIIAYEAIVNNKSLFTLLTA